jgi:L,D-transpeptidase ErfK/SrfK
MRFLTALLLLMPAVALAATEPFARLASARWEGEEQVVIAKGDNLSAIAGRRGLTPEALIRHNGLDPKKKLKIGDTLTVHYSHLIPDGLPESGITINVPQRLLFWRGQGELKVYALGLGKPSWPSPVGPWKVANKQENKTWNVPKSIQAEMAREGKPVKTHVPPGPDNPLGKHWLGLSIGGYGIHGTVAPSSLYRFRSHGCMRMHNDDIADLYPRVEKGLTGLNSYWPILLEIRPGGPIYIEVHPDIYKRKVNGPAELRQLADAQQVSGRIDWTLADAALKAAAGEPVEITLKPVAP